MDGAIFYVPQAGSAIPVVESVAVEQRLVAGVIGIVEGLSAAATTTAATSSTRAWRARGTAGRLREAPLGGHDQRDRACGG